MRSLLRLLFAIVDIVGTYFLLVGDRLVLALILMTVGTVGYLLCRDDLND